MRRDYSVHSGTGRDNSGIYDITSLCIGDALRRNETSAFFFFFALLFFFLLKPVGGNMSNGRGWRVLFNTAPKSVLSLFLLAIGKPGVTTDG